MEMVSDQMNFISPWRETCLLKQLWGTASESQLEGMELKNTW